MRGRIATWRGEDNIKAILDVIRNGIPYRPTAEKHHTSKSTIWNRVQRAKNQRTNKLRTAFTTDEETRIEELILNFAD